MTRSARPRSDEGKIEDPLNEQIATRASTLADRLGLSVTALADMTGIPRSRVWALLRNEQEWRAWQIRAVAAALGATPRHLLGEDDVGAIPVSEDEARLLVFIRQGNSTDALDLMTELLRRARSKSRR